MDYARLAYPFEIRSEVTDDGIFEGYGSVFDSPIVHPMYGRDIVKPGAFIDSITSKGLKGIKMLYQHDTTAPIGKWLDLAEDKKGLYVKGKLLLKLPKAQEAYELMKEKVIEGLSIGFDARDKANEWDPQRQTRTLHKVELFEVSPVTFPAQSIAKISSVKAADVREIDNIRDYEKFLREAGFSKHEAAELALKGWPPKRREAVEEQEPPTINLTGVVQALREARANTLAPLFGGFRNAKTEPRGI